MSNARDAFRAIVNERGVRLRKLTYEELETLNESPPEYVTVEKRSGRISTYVDKDMPSDGIRIVVQGFLKRRFFPMVWDSAIDGFCKYPNQTSAPLTKEDIRDFD